MKKLTCSVLALLMAISPLSAFAQTWTSPTPGETPVTLNTTPLTFNATVPTGLPLDLAANGVVTPATEAFIINGSIGPIKVVSITTETVDGWKLTSYTDDFSTKKVNSKDIALQFNKDNVQPSGRIALTPQNWPTIEGNGSLRLDYQGKLASQSEGFTRAIAANVSFVLDWDNNGQSSQGGLLLEASKDTLGISETAILSLTNTSKSTVAWENSNPNVVEITATKGRSSISQKMITAVGLGKSTISVTDDLGNKVTKDIVVVENELIGIEIVTMPTKTTYNKGEVFNPEGMKLKSIYKLGTKHDLKYFDFDETPIAIGQTEVIISYEERGVTVTTQCPITITTASLSNITINTYPNKTTYVEGEDFDSTGMIVKANYDDGSSIEINDYILSNNKSLLAGQTSVTIGYSNVTSIELPIIVTGPESPVDIGDKYVDGNYEYSYGQTYRIYQNSWENSNLEGWGVRVIDKTPTTYVQPLEEVHGEPVVSYMNMFYQYPNTTLALDGEWTNKNITDMRNMFSNSEATILDLRKFNTANVTDMNNMFEGSKATTLNVSKLNTANVTNMSSMFMRTIVTTLDLSSFNTSKVTDMSNMFTYSNVSYMPGLEKFNTSNVTNMQGMFWDNRATNLDLSGFNTSKVTDMSFMFYLNKATYIAGLNKFNTSKVTTMKFMFKESALPSLNLVSFDMSTVVDYEEMISNNSKSGYGRTQADVKKLNSHITRKPSTYMFIATY